jgi:hypothetical protein
MLAIGCKNAYLGTVRPELLGNAAVKIAPDALT